MAESECTEGWPKQIGADGQEKLLLAIRNGVSPAVAARTVGIPEESFWQWCRNAAEWPAEWPLECRLFYVDIETAIAEAKADAEKRVYKLSPVAWLRWGPGRETTAREGWGELYQIVGVSEFLSIIRRAVNKCQ